MGSMGGTSTPRGPPSPQSVRPPAAVARPRSRRNPGGGGTHRNLQGEGGRPPAVLHHRNGALVATNRNSAQSSIWCNVTSSPPKPSNPVLKFRLQPICPKVAEIWVSLVGR